MNLMGKKGIPFFFLIDFEMVKPVVCPLLYLTHDIEFCMDESCHDPSKKIVDRLKKNPISFEQYGNAFDKVKDEISYGNSYLLNLTFPTRIEGELSLEEVYRSSFAKFKLLVKDQFVVFSPEPFVTIKEYFIHSFPMKGTIDASLPHAEETLLADKKEMAEHYTIVDLIRNDLSMVATDVKVERFRYVEKIQSNDKSLLQVSSHIKGRLGYNWKSEVGDILFSMLPAGSVSGAPKKKTTEIIAETEMDDRGYYTGVFGIFNGGSLRSAVGIRYIEQRDGKFFYRSGGGITSMSDARSEYEEMINKIYVPTH